MQNGFEDVLFILIHGADPTGYFIKRKHRYRLAHSSDWFDKTQPMPSELIKSFPGCTVDNFGWNEYNSQRARYSEGLRLHEDLKKKCNSYRIVCLIGHSHGGNIAIQTSQSLDHPCVLLITIATPFVIFEPEKTRHKIGVLCWLFAIILSFVGVARFVYDNIYDNGPDAVAIASIGVVACIMTLIAMKFDIDILAPIMSLLKTTQIRLETYYTCLTRRKSIPTLILFFEPRNNVGKIRWKNEEVLSVSESTHVFERKLANYMLSTILDAKKVGRWFSMTRFSVCLLLLLTLKYINDALLQSDILYMALILSISLLGIYAIIMIYLIIGPVAIGILHFLIQVRYLGLPSITSFSVVENLLIKAKTRVKPSVVTSEMKVIPLKGRGRGFRHSQIVLDRRVPRIISSWVRLHMPARK